MAEPLRVMPSRYGTFGWSITNPTWNLDCARWMATSMCWSPMPCRMVCPVARSLCHERVISSSHKRVSVGLILAASICDLGWIATRYSAAGYLGAGMVNGCALSLNVSPVAETVNFETEPISPAWITFAGICSLPRWKCSPDMRSSAPLPWFHTRASACTEPLYTRK